MDRIEQVRSSLIEKVKHLDNEQLTLAPSEGKWSILQIIEHLVLAERDVLGNPSIIERRKPYQQNWKNVFGYYIVIGILRSIIKVPVPTRSMIPRGKKSLEELIADWDENHAALKTHLKLEAEGKRNGVYFKHPVSGPVTTKQALTMLEVHLNRHIKQINAILK